MLAENFYVNPEWVGEQVVVGLRVVLNPNPTAVGFATFSATLREVHDTTVIVETVQPGLMGPAGAVCVPKSTIQFITKGGRIARGSLLSS